MAEYGIMRNCEGYIDTTYGKAAQNLLPKPGMCGGASAATASWL